jgi:hypothetical protein
MNDAEGLRRFEERGFHDAVASGVFGGVEGAVGGGHDRFGRMPVGGKMGDADADRDRWIPFLG